MLEIKTTTKKPQQNQNLPQPHLKLSLIYDFE